MKRTRILVADPVAIFRTGVRNLLQRESDFDVVECANLDALDAAVGDEPPAVALVDLHLPPSGGLEATTRLTRDTDTRTIVWSFAPTTGDVLAAIRAGASGYLHKEISPSGLVRALRGLIAGEAPIARDLAALMIDGLHRLEEQATVRERAATLSAREREVLGLIAAGARNKDIASSLRISEFTVKRHVQNILQKLDLPTRYAAAGFFRAAFGESAPPVVLSRSA